MRVADYDTQVQRTIELAEEMRIALIDCLMRFGYDWNVVPQKSVKGVVLYLVEPSNRVAFRIEGHVIDAGRAGGLRRWRAYEIVEAPPAPDGARREEERLVSELGGDHWQLVEDVIVRILTGEIRGVIDEPAGTYVDARRRGAREAYRHGQAVWATYLLSMHINKGTIDA